MNLGLFARYFDLSKSVIFDPKLDLVRIKRCIDLSKDYGHPMKAYIKDI